jgi:hypothetical protein
MHDVRAPVNAGFALRDGDSENAGAVSRKAAQPQVYY